MAKDLPYFKFFVSEWNDGDITLEDYNIQGLFINVCAYYWSRECMLSYDILIKKFKHNKEDIERLISEDLIKFRECDMMSISFLDEQLEERKAKSKVNSVNGSKGGRPKKQKETENKPNALNSLTETKGIKKREDKRREDIPTKSIFLSYASEKSKECDLNKVDLKYESWIANDWKDGNNKPIINWKSKILNTLPYLKKDKDDSQVVGINGKYLGQAPTPL